MGAVDEPEFELDPRKRRKQLTRELLLGLNARLLYAAAVSPQPHDELDQNPGYEHRRGESARGKGK